MSGRNGSIAVNPKTTLFFLTGGLNDGFLRTTTTIANLSGEIRFLYLAGARNFSVALLPTKIPPFHHVAERLNPAIVGIPRNLQSELPGARIIVNRWGPGFDEVISSRSDYGTTNITRPCAAGREVFGENEAPCDRPDTYFYYQDGHPSIAVHRIVGRKVATEIAMSSTSKFRATIASRNQLYEVC